MVMAGRSRAQEDKWEVAVVGELEDNTSYNKGRSEEGFRVICMSRLVLLWRVPEFPNR